MDLDGKDRQLLSLLRGNARMSTTDLTKALGLSRTTVQTRMERMERRSIIDGCTVRFGQGHQARLIEGRVSIICAPRLTARVGATGARCWK
jgi:DNA-binding Lrp family transcriptional regulator